MSKNIHIFGCSFTEGIIEDTECASGKSNFPEFLSKLVDSDTVIYNWGRCATSLSFHLYLYKLVKKEFGDEDNIYILKGTNPGRLTTWSTPLKYRLTEISPNYIRASTRSKSNNIVHRSPANPKSDGLATAYYIFTDWDQFVHEYEIQFEYVKANFDFTWTHKNTGSNIGVESLWDILGKKQYYKFVGDDGDHFADEGNKWEAEWLFKKLKGHNLI